MNVGKLVIILVILILLLLGVYKFEDFAQIFSSIILVTSIIIILLIIKSYNGEDMKQTIGKISYIQQDKVDYLIKVDNIEFITTNTSLKIGDIVKIEYKRKDLKNQKCNSSNNIILLEEKEKK